MRKFSNNDLYFSGKWTFECYLKDACPPAFDDCTTLMSVECKLRAAKVLHSKTKAEMAHGRNVFYFSTFQSAVRFLRRLNRYLATFS